MATWFHRPLIPLPRATTLSFLCVPVWIVIPILLIRHWKDAPGLGPLTGYALAIPIALFLSAVGFALAFGNVRSTTGSARSRWAGLFALTLNTIPWFYILVANLFRP
jgi:hypothetical protein